MKAFKHLSILSGTVVQGDGYGKNIGFPTANIDRRQWSRLTDKPKFGVYAGTVEVHSNVVRPFMGPLQADKSANYGSVYKAGIVVGPVDSRGLPKLEAYLIGYSGNLYGEKITMQLQKYLHPFKKYTSEQELIVGIKKDIEQVKKIIK